MTISVNVFDEVGDVREDQTHEFKRSIFVDPEKRNVGFRQMQTIADTLAAFMNAEGGNLLVGISDDGKIVGIKNDLDILGSGCTDITLHTVRGNDEGYEYGNTADKYELKIHAIVRACLSANARECIGKVLVRNMGSQPVCLVTVKPCKPDEFVYSYHRYGHDKPEVAEIYVRFGNQKNKLEGEARDQFVRERIKRQVLANVQAAAASDPSVLVQRIMDAINQTFEPGRVVTVGGDVQVEGAVALDDPNFGVLSTPLGLVFDGKHVCDARGWTAVYEALLVKLNELDAAKFDGLPDAEYFKRYFVRVQPRKKYADYYAAKFGSNANVRAQKKGGKVYFTNPDYVVRRLLAHFGVELHRVALRGE